MVKAPGRHLVQRCKLQKAERGTKGKLRKAKLGTKGKLQKGKLQTAEGGQVGQAGLLRPFTDACVTDHSFLCLCSLPSTACPLYQHFQMPLP